MSARDHTHVDVMAPVAAHRTDVAELQDAQELRLQQDGHVANLVEQQRAAVGLGEQALARLDRAGEAAAHVAEELALEELLRNGGGVDRHEGTVACARSARGWRARRAPCRRPSRRSPRPARSSAPRSRWRFALRASRGRRRRCRNARPRAATATGTPGSAALRRISTASRTIRRSSSELQGLTMYWKAPRLMASTAWETPPAPVTSTNGSAGWVRLTRSSSSRPVIPSMSTSETTTSIPSPSMLRMAPGPSPTSSQACPSRARTLSSVSRASRSSSTMSTRDCIAGPS